MQEVAESLITPAKVATESRSHDNFVAAKYVEYVRPPLPKLPTTYIINWGKRHVKNGVDLANRCGTPIYAWDDGLVTLARYGWNGGYGTYVMIQHPNGVVTLYAHFSKIVVVKGQELEKGDLLGLMGTTGFSTGCHLHFEVRGGYNPFVYR